MAGFDVGIDLGTTNFRIYIKDKGIILDEPSVVAVKAKTKEVVAVGKSAYDMLGKNPPSITVKYPLSAGAISDYNLNEIMVKEFIKKASDSMLIKPQICISVHTLMTDVEKRSVIDAAIAAGARKVYLIDEAIASAIGAGIDMSRPRGVMIVNIGGGTIDVAILSMNGLVCGNSIKYGGQYVDYSLIKNISKHHKLNIGEQMAENLKINLATALNPKTSNKFKVSGRNIVSGLPESIMINQKEVYTVVKDFILKAVGVIKNLLEQTPPELSGDIYTNGIILTGAAAQLRGLATYIKASIGVGVKVASNPAECVVVGAGRSFDMLKDLSAGFTDAAYFMKRKRFTILDKRSS